MKDRLRRLAAFSAAVLSTFMAMAASADVAIRVQARPISDPIEVFVTVTDENGNPVPALDIADFSIAIDGVLVQLQAGDLTLPPEQDPNQKVSVLFAMDFSPSVTQIAADALRSAVITFIDEMTDGDFAAVLKFNGDAGATVVQPFVAIDHAANTQLLVDAVNGDYPGENTNIYDAVQVAIDHFNAPPNPLPQGPKAIILVSDGAENVSTVTESEAISLALDNGIPVFTIGVGSLDVPRRVDILTDLAEQTGGDFLPAPSDEEIVAAYATVSELLNNEYLITINSSITDCLEHTIGVAVVGQAAPATATFTRRTCDFTPDPVSFTSQTGVEPGVTVTSNTVTIMGIEPDVPAEISVSGGRYSIGCTDTFVTEDGTIANGETVCLRHSASPSFSTARTTTLRVGDSTATFTSTTEAEPGGGGGGGGGGGTTGLLALLGLAALAAIRRRRI